MKRLIITLDDNNQLSLQASEPLAPTPIIDLTLSAILAMFNTVMENVPQEQAQEMKEYLFNLFNISASALLAQFAPDIDLRPDITEEAILEAELKIASEKDKHANSSNS